MHASFLTVSLALLQPVVLITPIIQYMALHLLMKSADATLSCDTLTACSLFDFVYVKNDTMSACFHPKVLHCRVTS